MGGAPGWCLCALGRCCVRLLSYVVLCVCMLVLITTCRRAVKLLSGSHMAIHMAHSPRKGQGETGTSLV